MSSVLERIASIPAMAGLSRGDQEKLAAIAMVEEVPAGGVLFREGDPSDAVWLVVAGRIGLSLPSPGRDERVLLTVGPGDLVGWSALGLERRRVATGRVVEAATLVRLPTYALLALCDADHDVGYAVMRLAFFEVGERLHETRLQLLDMFGAG